MRDTLQYRKLKLPKRKRGPPKLLNEMQCDKTTRMRQTN